MLCILNFGRRDMGSTSKSLSFYVEMVSFTINLYIYIVISQPFGEEVEGEA